jgi:hypothetical protein
MTITVSVAAAISAQFSATVGSLTTSAQIAPRTPISYQDGTGAGFANKMHVSTRTLAASASENIDLAGGTITDPQGAVVTFTKIKAIHIRPAASNSGAVVVGGAASNAFVGPFGASTHTVAVPPGGILLLVDPNTGWTVTAGTADLLKITNASSTGSATYDIELFGEG